MRGRDGFPLQELNKQTHFHSPPTPRAAQQIRSSPWHVTSPRVAPSSKDEGAFFPRATQYHCPRQRPSHGHRWPRGVCGSQVSPSHSCGTGCVSGCGHTGCSRSYDTPLSPNLHKSLEAHFADWVLSVAVAGTEGGAQVPLQSATSKSTREKQDWAHEGSQRHADLTASLPAPPGALEQAFSTRSPPLGRKYHSPTLSLAGGPQLEHQGGA